jgi:hypothetical protein
VHQTTLTRLFRVAALAAPLAGLLACQAPPTILLGPEAASLRVSLERSLSASPTWKSVRVLDEGGVAPAARRLLRLTSAPGWALPQGSPPAGVFPANWARGANYNPPASLAALGKRVDGSWSSIPVLFDVWGATRFGEASRPLLGDLLRAAPPASLAIAGSRPSARQALYFLGLPAESQASSEAATWFARPADAMRPFAIFGNKAWVPNSWAFSRGDLASLYHERSTLTFLETYRDFETGNVAGSRNFALLAAAIDPARKAFAGTVLFLEYRGDSQGLSPALRLARFLLSSGFVKEAGISGHWLAADRNQSELDATGELIRRAVAGSPLFYPLTDHLPEALPERSLLAQIQHAVDKAPKR